MLGSTKRATAAEVKGDWVAFVDGLKDEVEDRREDLAKGKRLAPYDAPDAVLKRGVYGFVKARLEANEGSLLEDVLDNLRTEPLYKQRKKIKPKKTEKQIRHRRILFSENPFHCALRELPASVRDFRRDDYNRIGRQLLYAYRHDIDPDLLIGFLTQTGTMKEVADKAAAVPETYEKWYEVKLEAEKLNAARKTRYPLAVICFTATSTERDSCPIEMGFAKARGRNAPISFESFQIRPDPTWDIEKKWDRTRESQTGILVKDLHDSDAAREVIERLAELSAGMTVVHCKGISNVSHWLDMLISAAGKETDFQLRDVGDFLDHNANKRADLRRKLRPIPVKVGSAGSEAQQLCETLRSVANH